MRVTELAKVGRASGIAALLLPIPQEIERRIRKLQRNYTLVPVTPRRSRRAKDARRTVTDPLFRQPLFELYLEFLQPKNSSRAVKSSTSMKALLNWIMDSQIDESSPLFQFLRVNAQEVVYDHDLQPRVRARRWWAAQLTRRWWVTQLARHQY